MLTTILEFGKKESEAIRKGISSTKIGSLEVKKRISMLKWTKEEEVEQLVKEIEISMKDQFNNLLMEVTV
jgi:V/A-type H+-transporting ATPase subunit A